MSAETREIAGIISRPHVFHSLARSVRAVAASAVVPMAFFAAGCAGFGGSGAGSGLFSAPESTVPERRTVGASSTPVETGTARNSRAQTGLAQPQDAAGQGLADAATSISETAPFADTLTPTTASGTSASAPNSAVTVSAASVNAPLFMPGDGEARPVRRTSLELPGTYAPTRLSVTEAPTEGATNLSQVSFAPEGGDFSPDIDRGGTFMVFASTQHRPTFDLYRKNIDGRTVTLLTDDPSDDLMPAISPDGSTVAFASNRTGNWDIFTMPLTGGAPTQITFDADEEVQPTWSPDGKRLAFSRLNGRTGAWEIWIIDTTAAGVRTFVCEGFQPRWSPATGEDKLLFQRARQRGSRLYGVWTIEIENGEGVRPTEVLSARNAAILQPNWSPDGTRIVFTTVTDATSDSRWPERSELWVINSDGTGRMSLTRDQFRNMQPVWGADGRVYFVSNRSGVENVWALSVDRTHSAKPAGMSASRTAKPARRPTAPANPGRTGQPADFDEAAEAGNTLPDFLRADQAGPGNDE